MAIYHCTTKTVNRSSGRTAVASMAYRAGEKLKDERTGLTHDFTKKGGVAHTEIISNLDIDIDRSQLWNLAEQSENRKDARTAREWVIALPDELNPDQRKDLAKDFARSLVDRYGVIADIAIHEPSKGGSDKNHHAHIMLTTRKAELDTDNNLILTTKADIELSNAKRKILNLATTQDEIKQIRETWANLANHALERAGIQEKIDHRSYADQGNGLQATIHEGTKVTQLRRQGIDTEISLANDAIKERNEQRQLIRGLEQEIIATERLVANLQRDQEQRQKEKQPQRTDAEKLQLASKVITQFNSKVNELSRTYAMQYNQEVKEKFNHDLALVQREKTSLEQQIQNMGNRPRLWGAKDWDAKKDRLQADWHRATEKEKELKGELQKRTLDANHFKDKAFNDVSKDNQKARENFDKANAYREKQLQQKEPQKDQDKQAERQARLDEARRIGEAEKANKAQLDKEREQRTEKEKQQRMR